ncbi:RHS repeat domain-containing protein [Capnocytophaga canis]|uniref:RHS repeat domain-containing protein n=1 Tax=Capnocytophaga canis TaxID=1848903 RepID=UPI0037D725D9
MLLHEVLKTNDNEKVITWVYEQGSFVPTAKLIDNKSFSIVSDYIGRPVLAFDENGEKVWSTEYDIYGKLTNLQGDKAFIPFRQLGQYEDVETGLYYNRFRYYDCSTGTYISQDPIGLLGNNPNIYAYVFDSNTEVDVFGLNIIWNSKANRWYDSSNSKFVKRPTHLMKTKPNTAYFWSGRTNRIGGMDVAADIAKKNGGTTLEMLIEENNIVMPEWDTNKPLNVKEWGLMSEAYAEGASGKVTGVIGDDLRPGNIWEGYEKRKIIE